jgi:hypothetical protein
VRNGGGTGGESDTWRTQACRRFVFRCVVAREAREARCAEEESFARRRGIAV